MVSQELLPDQNWSLFSLWVRGVDPFKNLKWIALEVSFGEQIVQLLSDTSSVAAGVAQTYSGTLQEIGMVAELEAFLPRTWFASKFSSSLTDLLLNKYVRHYNFIAEDSASSRVGYRLNKVYSCQLSAYSGRIGMLSLGLEFALGCVTSIATGSIQGAIASTALWEAARRVLKF